MGMGDFFVELEARLDKVTPAQRCLCGLSLRHCVMCGAIFMTIVGCVLLIHSPWSMVFTIWSLFNSEHSHMQAWAFVYVHLYVICLHLLIIIFLLYAVPLSVLALRSAHNYETAYMKSYFRMNVQVAGLLVLLCFFNTMLDRTMCAMRDANADVIVHWRDGAVQAEGGSSASDQGYDWQCDAFTHMLYLFGSVCLAVVYCYLAWITYCYRREQDQGTQLEDDGPGGEAAAPRRENTTPEPRKPHPRPPHERPMGMAVDVELPERH
mmetsp:Transcript_18265/g.49145  ORF Transcript_18265/g.49145 Transcript_18265/m.49145 type:complete len:265 (-) Transcript_18265:223-1017(-)|eukprot:CAMPEP_0185554112 /NCGR_PEP_ID=MMETSP1381-20130426/40185_1 /TAXON_ID=298111 /ORGANISM="Pavlova sp., Strain CCMP459" /LENGTH=264 /DNA_ID=CAMNT_0028167289 /DNA_START=24 /DNA_END=818 /DNA_ORIENTATION=-